MASGVDAAALGLPEGFVGNATLLGTGSFGEVWLCSRKNADGNLEPVAVKINKKPLAACNNDHLDKLKREAKNQGVLNSQHVCRLFDVGVTTRVPRVSADNDGRERIFLVLEYAEGSALSKHIPLEQNRARVMFLQLLLGLRHGHAQHIFNRDIKPDNCLISEKLLKVADFGLSKCLEEDGALGTVVGTPVYMAPEVYDMNLRDEQGHYDGGKVDVYSCGVTLFQMIFGHFMPFCFGSPTGGPLNLKLATDRAVLTRNKAASRWWPPQEAWPADPILRDLLDGMLQARFQKRLSLAQVLAHPWCRQGVGQAVVAELDRPEPEPDAALLAFQQGFKDNMDLKFDYFQRHPARIVF